MAAKNVIQNFPENPEPAVTQNSSKKFPHLVIVRAPSLLAMDYKIQEIVEELGVPNSTLRDWLNKGAPHHRDRRGHIWINGAEFAKWVQTQRKKPKRKKLEDEEAFCFRCNRAVKLGKPQIIPIVGKLINIRGKCLQCGCVINRAGRQRETR